MSPCGRPPALRTIGRREPLEVLVSRGYRNRLSQLCGLEQQKFIPTTWRLGVNVLSGPSSLRRLSGGGLSWSRPASGGFRHSLACGRITQNSASCPHGLPLCPCVSPLCLQRYLSLDLGTTWITHNDLLLRSLTISANTLFPNKVTFTGFGDQDVNIAFLRLPFNPADDHKPLAESAES